VKICLIMLLGVPLITDFTRASEAEFLNGDLFDLRIVVNAKD